MEWARIRTLTTCVKVQDIYSVLIVRYGTTKCCMTCSNPAQVQTRDHLGDGYEASLIEATALFKWDAPM